MVLPKQSKVKVDWCELFCFESTTAQLAFLYHVTESCKGPICPKAFVHDCRIGHFRVLLGLCFKTSLSAKPFIRNEFCMQFHSHANQSHFHENGFALRLALKQRHKGTWKWPIQSMKCVVWVMPVWSRALDKQ